MAHGYLTPEAAGENNLFKTIDDLLKKLSKRGEKNGPPPETGGALAIVKKGQNADIYKEPDVQEVKVQEQISKGGSLAKRAGSSIMKGIGGSFSNMMKRGGPGAIATGGAAPSPGANKSGNVGGGSVASPAAPLNAQSFLNKQTGDVDLAGLNDWFGRQKAAGNPDATRGTLASVMSEGASIRSGIDSGGGNDIVAAMAANTAAIVRMEQAVKDQTDNDTEISVRETQSSEALVQKQLSASKEARMEKGGDFSNAISPDAAGQGGSGGGAKGILGGLTNLLGGRRGGGLGGLFGKGKKGKGLGGAVRGLKGLGGRLLGKGAAKGAAKGASKGLLKGGLKMGIKKIPFLGLGAAALFAGQRAMAGDFAGAGLELASGGASMLPGLGTAASLGIDAALMARDATMPQMQGGGLTSGPKSGYLSMMHGTELTLSGSKSRETLKVGEMLGEGMINAQKKGKKVLSEVAGFFWEKSGYNVLFKAFKEGLKFLGTILKTLIPGLSGKKGDGFLGPSWMGIRNPWAGGGGGDVDAPDLKTKIRQLESGDDYGSMYNRNRGTFDRGQEDITKMTIDEVDQLQTDYLNHQKSLGFNSADGSDRSAAMGAYQMIEVLKVAKALKIDTSKTKFDKETQDKMSEYYLNIAGYQKWKKGEITDAQFNDGLAVQFASVKKASGGGAYDGDGMNSAYGNIMPLLAKLKKEGKDPKPEPTGNLDDIPYTQEEKNALVNAGTEELYDKILARIKKRQAAELKKRAAAKKRKESGIPNSAPEISENYGVNQGKSFNFSVPGKGNYEAYKTATGFEIFKHGGIGALVGAKTRIDTKDGANSWAVEALMKAGEAKVTQDSLTPANPDQTAKVNPASSAVASGDRQLNAKAQTVVIPGVADAAKSSSSGIPVLDTPEPGSSGQGLNAFVIPRTT